MPLPWVRLDTSMPDHPKIIELCERGDVGLAAAFVWTCSLTYAAKHRTEGLIVRGVLVRLNGKTKHAALLVDVRLWDTDPLGWRIHKFEEYQMLVPDFDAMFSPDARSNGGRARAASMTAEERSEAARKAAQARWNGASSAY